MKDLFSALPGRRWLKPAALALGLLGAADAGAQSLPATIYGLGAINGAPQLFTLNPQRVNQFPVGDITTAYVAITGLGAGQRLLGIDVRPATGQLYALAYNTSTGIAQLYTLSTAGALTAVNGGATVALDLQDSNSANRTGVVFNVGFDFNPRVDRIRVVAPNGTNYRLNPNTGGLAATDNPLAYAANTVNHAPYIGAAAYTNSTPVGAATTTLYDLDITAVSPSNLTGGLLARQVLTTPDDGTLVKQADLTFYTLQTSSTANNLVYDPPLNQPGYYLATPLHRLDLDIYYSPSTGTNRAYLLEARTSTNYTYSMNLYEFDLATGKAVGENIFGSNAAIIYDIAAAPAFPKVWTGTTDTNWGEASNWSPSGVPTSADNVLILGTNSTVQTANGAVTVARQPIVSDAQQAAAVTLSNNAVLTTANGGTLTLAGNFTNNDSQVAGSGTGIIVLAGTSALDISGNTTTSFWNLGIGANGAGTSAPVSIRRSVQVSGNLTIGTNQAFTLLSNASGTAYAFNNNSSASIIGLATVQRYITPTNPGPGYRHYSSPVTRNAATAASTSNQINDLAVTGVFTPTVNAGYNSSNAPKLVRPYPTVFYYEQSRLASSNSSYAVGDFDNGFLSPADYTTEFEPARGYTVNLPATALVDFQGTLNQNAQYQRTNLARGAQNAAGYHLLGNPYPGAINYDLFIGSASGMESALYVYKSSGQYTGTYTTYVPPTGIAPINNGPSVSANGGTNNIPLGQGFFMRVAVGQTGTVNIPTAARTNAPETALFQRTASTLPLLSLTASNGSIANQTVIYFDQTATPAFDAARDAHYLPATHGLDLASDLGTESLAINGLPLLTGTTVAVPLRLHAPAAGTYTLTVDELANLPGAYSAYLRDNLSNTYTDLATTPRLTVTLDPADAATGRFTVVFSTTQPLANAPATLAALVSLYPNPAHGAATLVLPQALRGQAASQVEVLNALGQVVLRRTVAASSPEAVELPLTGLAAGLYTVRAVTATGAVARQLHVE